MDAGCWMLDAGCWMLDAGCWMLDAGCWMLDAGCWMLDAGCWMLDRIISKAGISDYRYFYSLSILTSTQEKHYRESLSAQPRRLNNLRINVRQFVNFVPKNKRAMA
ncbi:hypothetical protein [Shewanella gelidii]|uniref:hypothetical protein n=1 Tax=Shewanella gelidii TaxID=1642821 RepID=UPI00188C1345|nr:hypothetical protein [Shewanella gelidii]